MCCYPLRCGHRRPRPCADHFVYWFGEFRYGATANLRVMRTFAYQLRNRQGVLSQGHQPINLCELFRVPSSHSGLPSHISRKYNEKQPSSASVRIFFIIHRDMSAPLFPLPKKVTVVVIFGVAKDFVCRLVISPLCVQYTFLARSEGV